MALNESEGSAKAAPGVYSCPANAPANSGNAPKNQASLVAPTYQRVTGGVGPIHLIGDSRVVIERHPSRAFVWVENPIWGWPDARREFLNPGSPAILKYAHALAYRIRDAALAEEARRARIAEARKQEAAARLAEWEARK